MTVCLTCVQCAPAQLLNKIGENRKQTTFTSDDAAAIRSSLEFPLIDACDLIALGAGRRKSFAEALDAASIEKLEASLGQ